MRTLTPRVLVTLALVLIGAGGALPAAAAVDEAGPAGSPVVDEGTAAQAERVQAALALDPQVDPDPEMLERAASVQALEIAAAAPPMPAQGYNGEVRAAVGTWGGYSNGQIPLSRMCSPGWDAVEEFRCDAQAAFAAMNQAYREAFGVNIAITDSYRSYDEQVALKIQKPTLAATPGTSNHGWGLAADLSGGIQTFGSAQHNWMRANANRFGWYHPAWAQYYGSLPEPWHWEYAGAVASGDPAHARALGLELVRDQQWDSSTERICLADLWQRASGWDYRAVGTGDLRGLPQVSMRTLYGTWWSSSSAAALYLANPQTQVEAGLRDITTRFGSACSAAGKAARLLGPALSASSVPQGTAVTLTAVVIGEVDWRLDVTDARSGVVVHQAAGSATHASGLEVTWDARSTIDAPVGPGPYRFTLNGTDVATGLAVPTVGVPLEVTGSQNPPTVAPSPLVGDLRYVPIPPARLLDTRTHAQSLGPASRMDLQVAGVAGVPSDARAVTLNVTAVHSSAVSFIRAWPAGHPMPGASVLNTDSNRSAAGAGVIIGIGGQGKVSLFNNAGSTHLVVDVTGYYTSSTGDAFAPLATGYRALDTREGGGVPAPGAPRTVKVTGVGGIPADARAVVVNVASAGATGAGFVAVVPRGGAVTTASVNHLPGTDVANRATVAVADGQVDVHAAGGTGNVVLDVVGWYGPGGTARFTPVQPVRVVDTRASGTPIGHGQSRSVDVVRATAIPSDAVAATVSMTATQQTSGVTFLTAYPTGSARPETSDLNTGAGRDQGNLAVVRLGAGGAVDFYNNAGSTHLVVDLTGYFRTTAR